MSYNSKIKVAGRGDPAGRPHYPAIAPGEPLARPSVPLRLCGKSNLYHARQIHPRGTPTPTPAPYTYCIDILAKKGIFYWYFTGILLVFY